ncbi:hypothetical protein MSAN_00830900 [Mycena sanguinolenta]|uniref:Uncharacterized protein n=1 Tax=Mycena sanguinolenta TaxID=230812 RepID=A0A8H6YZ66_9AGAR|nr:hypothetical protein MSAN_00830900 [Mycena sanguinolenta]
MLWVPCVRKTRSGATFAAWTAEAFHFGPLVSQAVRVECDDQEDIEPGDSLPDPDIEWPASPADATDAESTPLDPLNDVNDLPPSPLPAPRKRRASPTFEEVCATGKPLKSCHRRRAAKRVKTIHEEGHRPRASVIDQQVRQADPLAVPSLNAEALPAAQGAYVAKIETKIEKRGSKTRRSLAELIGLGFQLIPWDGMCAFYPIQSPSPRTCLPRFSSARPLADGTGRIFASLAGQPQDDEWRAAVARAYQFIKAQGNASDFPTSMRHHQRGLFAAMNVGLMYGKGLRSPTWLDNKKFTPLAERLLAHPDVARMAHFASFTFSLWAPRLYRYYVDHNATLANLLPGARRPFPKSVFASATFNFGPSVCTFKHRDVCNLPFGWCAIQALGSFDATAGGHLVLWDAKVVVEFPAGAVILLPSATVAHSNVPVADGEERISFTQFTPGGLFRWVDYGGRTEAQLAAEDPDEYSRMLAQRDKRWGIK